MTSQGLLRSAGRSLLVAAALVLSGCSAGIDPGEIDPALARPEPGEGSAAPDGQGPERLGPRVQVLEVGATLVFVQDSEGGLCVEAAGDAEAVGCGFEVPERQEVGFYRAETDTGAVVVGVVVAEAVTVRVELAAGEPLSGPAQETGEVGDGVRAFAVTVPADAAVTAVVALDADGAEVGRRSG